jgi:Rrf2 family protein
MSTDVGGGRRQSAGLNRTMEVSARVDYGMRALLELAHQSREDPNRLVTCDTLAKQLTMSAKFLENILRSLRQGGIIASQRGSEGGYRLAQPAHEVTVADVIRALEGPLAGVRGRPPEEAIYPGRAEHLREVWVATRAALRDVLEHVTLADIETGHMPPSVTEHLNAPGAWKRREVH